MILWLIYIILWFNPHILIDTTLNSGLIHLIISILIIIMTIPMLVIRKDILKKINEYMHYIPLILLICAVIACPTKSML